MAGFGVDAGARAGACWVVGRFVAAVVLGVACCALAWFLVVGAVV